jgi:hypothetical protein
VVNPQVRLNFLGGCLVGIALGLSAALSGCVNQTAQRQPSRSPAPSSDKPAPTGSPSKARPQPVPPTQTVDSGTKIPEVGPQSNVKVFDKAHVYWVSSNDNHRSVKQEVDFPEKLFLYESVQLNIRLECPPPACDAWDRRGAIYLHLEDGQKVELARFMTPYGVGAGWKFDVAPLVPVLVGRRTVEVEIDTWVGPGHSQGAGWLVTADLAMTGGRPKEYPFAVIPVFQPQNVDVGDPIKDPRRSFTGDLPSKEFSSAKLISIVTGHGQGNTENCAEFCAKNHSFTVGGKMQQRRVWRDNCSRTVTNRPQRGTWTLARAGWCPGASVEPLVMDLAGPLDKLTVEYLPQAYVNNARTGYNDGSHTQPYYQMSAVVVLYRAL